MYPPDFIGGFVAYLRTSPDVSALSSTRVSASLQAAWAMPTYAVLVRAAGGTRDGDVGHLIPRLDIFWYGPDLRTAMDLWRRGHAWLCPTPEQGRPVSFIAANARVYDIAFEGGPLALPEPDTGWPRVVATYRPRVSEIPA